MERDRCWGNIDFGIKISTHTLTWSVTIPKAQFTEFMVISTHTLTWSVTPFVGVSKQKSSISTHTLTWSVTEGKHVLMNVSAFQLTRSRGA